MHCKCTCVPRSAIATAHPEMSLIHWLIRADDFMQVRWHELIDHIHILEVTRVWWSDHVLDSDNLIVYECVRSHISHLTHLHYQTNLGPRIVGSVYGSYGSVYGS